MKPCEIRGALYDAIQSNAFHMEQREDDEQVLPDRIVCTGWVVVAEFMDPQGGKWLTVNTGDASNERLTDWAADGMLRHGMEIT